MQPLSPIDVRLSFKLSSAFLIALGAFPAYSQTIDGGSIVTVPGSQSSPWNLGASSLTVGNTSTGTLQIGATGVVSNGSGFIGRQVGSTGHVTVSGTGAQWTNSAGLSVGFSGTGTLGVSNGGVVRSTTNTYVGVAAGGTGTVTVSGLGSQLNTTGFMRVGQTGNGTLQISDSAVVSNAAAVVGYDPGSVGVVTVSGAGTQWNSSAQLSVGASGNGAVTISNDAVVSATSAVVGAAASSQGVINIGAAALAAAAAPGTLSLTGPSPSLTLGATGGLVFNHTNTAGYVFTPGITGAGKLSTYNGTTILTANNNYTGGTTIAGGTLQLGNGGTSGAIVGNVANNGILNFNRTDSVTFAGLISGSGVVNQNGTGATILTANNTYTGGTAIAAGTLQLGNGGTTGAIVGNVANNGALVFDRSNTLTFAGQISGSGSVSQIGAGTTVLTADSTYTGGTTISAGTLQLGSGGTSGAILGNVVDNGALTFNRSDVQTFAGQISGGGVVNQIGTGTTILTADNTYTGGTTISAGTLQLGNGGTTGAIPGDVTNNGALTFNRSDVQTFPGLISGSGTVNQIGSGTTTLTADNTYTGGTTIAAGTLQLGNGGTSGAILGDVANSGALSFNRSDAVTFAGLISGSGTVNQNGTGTTILTAQNTYGGPTNVNNGVLRAGAASTLSPNSAVNVAAAGTLDLSGYNQTVAGVTNAGLINMGTGTAPGTTLTTPNYAGQGGRIAMNTLLGDDSSPSDRLVINGGTASGSSSLIVTNAGGAGAVTTGNGILLVDAVNGGTTATSAFTLGNAGGYVAAGPYAYTLQRSSVDASGLQNWYLRSTVDCAAAPSNPACKNPEPPVPPNPPEPPVPPNPPTPVPPAPPNYRPEVSTAVATPELALRYGSTFLDSLHERIGEARYALPSTPTGSNSLAWGRVIGVTGERNGSNSGILGSRGPDYDYKIYGLQSGVDLYRRANANGSMDHAGAYVAFGRATADVDHLDGRSAGQAAMNGVTLGGYWTHIGKEGWYVDAVIQGTRYDVDNGRSPAGYNLDTRGFGFATSLEGGYPFRLNDEWVIEPQAQLVFQNVNLNDANDGAAKIRFNDVDSLRGRLGVRLARTVELDPGPDGKRVATTWLRASLVNEFLTNPTTEFSSQNGYVPFRADMKGASVQLNLGADVGVKRNVSMYGSVGSEISLRGDGQNFNGKLGVKIAF